jgi:hypothetical protein
VNGHSVFPVELNAMFGKMMHLIFTPALRKRAQMQCGRGKNILNIFLYHALTAPANILMS